MSLKEATGSPPSKGNVNRSSRASNFHDYPYVASYVSNVFKNSHSEALDKARWQSAVKEAQDRGLDGSEQKKTVRELRQHTFRKARRHPVKHAQVLLNETSLPFFEIAQITGLNVYQVVSIKLQLREAA
ncbi:hypothetical protein OAJ77_09290 [Rhodospirillales bacterium]|nr:hypothetical protein [Rhodospirillales bacterium]